MGRWIVIIIMLLTGIHCQAQTEDLAVMDSIAEVDSRALLSDSLTGRTDTASVVIMKEKQMKPKRDWATWKPNPQRALWLAMALPGAGQIYNRKYWKLPIIYGGFMGCIYALTWNDMMYKDYSQAYLDIMDDDPATASYNKFLHLGIQITPANEERYKQLFKSRKDKYRRWRDMSFFVMIGVYALSVIDAYVDAELSEFDISKDLSLKVSPAVIPNHSGGNPLQAQSLGVNCSLSF
ncbi:MAG: hypothetical protein K2O48_02395 [Prevotella sp.]|nr:hypothetical protein [Prevotella sp.]